MVSLIRRVLGALVLAVSFGSALRFTAKSTVPQRSGGWRALEAPGYR